MSVNSSFQSEYYHRQVASRLTVGALITEYLRCRTMKKYTQELVVLQLL